MPNIAMENNKSITTIYSEEKIKSYSQILLEELGEIVEVKKEEQLINTIGINSSGIAYIAKIMDILEEDLKNKNYNEEEIKKKSLNVIKGYLSQREKYSNKEIINKISTPNGITEKGIEKLNQNKEKIKDFFK